MVLFPVVGALAMILLWMEKSWAVCLYAYYAGCEEVGTQDNTTLSLTDLTKVGPLLTAYDTFGSEALAAALQRSWILLTVRPCGGKE